MEKLRTDYEDAVFQGLRKYRKIDNSDGTVSFRDVTDYTTEGSFFRAEDVNATNEAVNAAQKKDSVDGVVYEELFLARVYILKLLNNALLLAGTLNLGENLNVYCKISTYGDISQEETIRISWCSGEGSVTCMSGEGMSLGQIPTICMYKNGMYSISVMEVLKQAATFEFSRIEFRSKSAGAYIFEEKTDDAYGAVANLMKQIGTTPLGFGNGTLTEAIAELAKSESNIRKILSILYPESISQTKKEFTSSSATTKEVIYEAKTDCYVSFSGFAQFLRPTENAIVVCNILVEQDLIQENTDGSQTHFTRSTPVTAITGKATTTGTNLPFDTKLKMRAGEVLKVQHVHLKGAEIQMNLYYFLNVIS